MGLVDCWLEPPYLQRAAAAWRPCSQSFIGTRWHAAIPPPVMALSEMKTNVTTANGAGSTVRNGQSFRDAAWSVDLAPLSDPALESLGCCHHPGWPGHRARATPPLTSRLLEMLCHQPSTRMLARTGAWAAIICMSTSIAYAADHALVDLVQVTHKQDDLRSGGWQSGPLSTSHVDQRWIGLSFKDVDGAPRRYDCLVSSDAFPDSVLSVAVQDMTEIDFLVTNLPCYGLQFIE